MALKLRTIWHLMRGQRLRYGGALVALGFSALFLFLVPLVIRATIDSTIAGRSLDIPSFLVPAFEWLGTRNEGAAILAKGKREGKRGKFLIFSANQTSNEELE